MRDLLAEINTRERDLILTSEEGHTCDLKAIEVSPAKLTHSLSAFANADGGELFIGIDEDRTKHVRRWRGFPDQESANAHLQVLDSLFPLGQSCSYTFLRCESEQGLVLKVSILKTPDVKYASNRVPYIRRGAGMKPVESLEDLRRLEMSKGVISFESEPVNAPINSITESAVIRKFMSAVVPKAEPPAWLHKERLIIDEKPTVAGILLFADEPQAILPKHCSIKIYRYKTTAPVGSRDTLAENPLTIEGCLYDQVQRAVRQTIDLVEGIPILADGGLTKIKYPDLALHEIITNAILHRDYSIKDDIHIRIFDNRIEVQSPGRLAGHVTPENILRERYSRNGAVVRLMNKFPNPPNKDVGEGLRTAFEELRKLRLKDPIIREEQSSVLVIIRHEPLASPEEIVLQFLETHETINNTQARELAAIPSENIVKKMFVRLRKSGLVERVPELRGKHSAWRKKRQEDGKPVSAPGPKGQATLFGEPPYERRKDRQ